MSPTAPGDALAVVRSSADMCDIAGMTSTPHVADLSLYAAGVSPGMIDDNVCHDVAPQQ